MPAIEAYDGAAYRQAMMADLNPCLAFNETITPLASSGTYTGAARDTGADSGLPGRYSTFNAYILADQTGVARIECSNNGTTWGRMTTDQALAVNAPLVLTVPVMSRYHRVVVVNGSTAQTSLRVNSAYTAA